MDEWPDIPLCCAYMPVIGTVVAIVGAAEAWKWSYLSAMLFFCWPYLLYTGLARWFGTAALLRRPREP